MSLVIQHKLSDRSLIRNKALALTEWVGVPHLRPKLAANTYKASQKISTHHVTLVAVGLFVCSKSRVKFIQL
jgi:hypothetical protein